MPSDISKRLCTVHDAPPELIQKAIDGAVEAKQKWERMSLDQRTSIFLKAAELLSGKYRNKILAATMMGQGKTMYQAEIDAAAETIDFLRFNALYAQRMFCIFTR
jgi:1-pyrroline-5-carboxylate dehydrogenase